jgi:hypothetical protein
MAHAVRLPLAARLAIAFNAAVYLFGLHSYASSIVLRHYGPASVHSDRAAFLTCAWLMLGLIALFVRRPEGVLVAVLTSSYLVIIGWAPILVGWFVRAPDALASSAGTQLVQWAVILTVLGLVGLVTLLVPSARRSLAGTPAA